MQVERTADKTKVLIKFKYTLKQLESIVYFEPEFGLGIANDVVKGKQPQELKKDLLNALNNHALSAATQAILSIIMITFNGEKSFSV